MLKCPFCGETFEEHAWGMHTIECELNPKNKVKVKIAVKDPKHEEKAKAKRKK